MNPIIEVKNLSKAFSGKKAVDGLSFQVPEGSLFAFLGQNGAGKSTTINMLIGLLKKDGGSIRYNLPESGEPLRSRIGVVFQNNICDGLLTVEENLRLYGSLYLKSAGENRVRTREISDLLALNAFSGKRFNSLSGGQKRKTEIARALLTSPQVLFLDEPTTGLDPQTRAEVWNIIRSVRQKTGMTVFLTTHYMEETADADSVVIIHAGKLISAGSPAELKARYSFDRILLTPENADELEAKLGHMNVAFTKTADTYLIRVGSARHIVDLLGELKDNIRFLEVKRGSMDDVFLNAVGENLRVEESA